MKILRALFLVTLISGLSAGCSKEKKLERMLFKGKGIWNITSVIWEKTSQDSTTYTYEEATTFNAGSFAFDKDRSGAYEYTIDSIKYADAFNWEVEDENIYINYSELDTSLSGLITYVKISFTGTETADKEITLESSYVKQISTDSTFSQTSLIGVFFLKKG